MGHKNTVLLNSMVLALTGVKSYFPNSFPSVSLVAEKTFRIMLFTLVLSANNDHVHLIEQGQLVILSGSIIKGSRPFYFNFLDRL